MRDVVLDDLDLLKYILISVHNPVKILSCVLIFLQQLRVLPKLYYKSVLLIFDCIPVMANVFGTLDFKVIQNTTAGTVTVKNGTHLKLDSVSKVSLL